LIDPCAFFQHDIRGTLDEQLHLREASKIESPRNRRERELDIKPAGDMPDHGAVLPLISGFCHQDDRQGAGGRPTHSERLEGQCVQAAVRCSERPHYLAGGYPSAIDADPKRRGDVFLLYPAAVDRGAGDGRRKKDEM
jgi:hypothetical protein